jgi:hypothetical protein
MQFVCGYADCFRADRGFLFFGGLLVRSVATYLSFWGDSRGRAPLGEDISRSFSKEVISRSEK